MNMYDFLEKNTQLRLEVINYITDYLKEVNRNLMIPHGALTYLCWDYAQEPTDEDMVSLVPEMELTLVGLNQKEELFFIDASGEEVHQGNLDTEELIYVADFIDDLKSQLSYSELAQLQDEFENAFICDKDCPDDWSDKGLGDNALLTYIEERRTGVISGPDEFNCPDKWRKSTKS